MIGIAFGTYIHFGSEVLKLPVFEAKFFANPNLTLPFSAGNEVDWGDGTIDNLNTHTYSVAGNYDVVVTGEILDFGYSSNPLAQKLSIIEVNNMSSLKFDNSSAEAFRGCSNLTSVQSKSPPKMVGLTSLNNMFRDCISLSFLDINNWNTSNITTFIDTFNSCNSLTSVDLSKWTMENAGFTNNMFYRCDNLTDVDLSSSDFSNVIYAVNMFNDCRKLHTISSNWDLRKIVYMNGFAQNCFQLNNISTTNWGLNKAVNVGFLFSGCTSLTSIDTTSWNLSKAQTTKYMFYGCRGLSSLDVSGFDMSSNKDMEHMFNGCSLITELAMDTWNIGSLEKAFGTLVGITLTNDNYSDILNNFGSQPVLNNVMFSGGDSIYNIDAYESREDLINNYGWFIFDGGLGEGVMSMTVNSTSAHTYNPSFAMNDLEQVKLIITPTPAGGQPPLGTNFSVAFDSGEYNIDAYFNASKCFGVASNDQMTEIDISKLLELEILFIGGNKISNLNINNNPKMIDLSIFGNSLSEANIDQIIIELDSNGLSNGAIGYEGNQFLRSPAGLIALENLHNKSWNITPPFIP